MVCTLDWGKRKNSDTKKGKQGNFKRARENTFWIGNLRYFDENETLGHCLEVYSLWTSSHRAGRQRWEPSPLFPLLLLQNIHFPQEHVSPGQTDKSFISVTLLILLNRVLRLLLFNLQTRRKEELLKVWKMGKLVGEEIERGINIVLMLRGLQGW